MSEAARQPLIETSAKPRRRLFRFRLASMLLLVAICGAWLASMANRAQRQMRAVQFITQWGGHVFYDYQSTGAEEPPYPSWLRNCVPHDYLATVREVDLAGSTVTDDGLRVLLGLPDLEALVLEGTQVGDVGLGHLAGLTKLRVLALDGTNCTDDGLKLLKPLNRMEFLELTLTKITDHGLAVVRNMPVLGSLYLSGTPVGDAGLHELRYSKKLNLLHLGGTEISEAGLSELRQVPELEFLYVPRRSLTEAGMNQLKQLPKLRFLMFERTEDVAQVQAELKQKLPRVIAEPRELQQQIPAGNAETTVP